MPERLTVRFNSISEEISLKKFEKVQYCIKNSIPLLRISYKEFQDIPEILSEKILGMALISKNITISNTSLMNYMTKKK